MKRTVRTQWFLTTAMALLPAMSALAVETYFNDSTKVNVMRQFNPIPHTQKSGYSEVRTQTGAFRWDYFGNPWKPAQREGGSFLSDLNTATSTITLPSAQTIGSFRVQWCPSYQANYPTKWVLEGYNPSDGWFSLYTAFPSSYDTSGTFAAPKTVTQVRYTASGTTTPGPAYGYNLGNLNLYLSAGQSVPLYGAGYSLIHDTSRVLSTNTSPSSATWNNFNYGGTSGYDAISGNYESYNLKTQDAARRGYMTWNFDQKYYMDFGVLAGVYDYTVGNWEVYTANSLNIAALNALTTTTPAAIEGLGWTLQYQQVGTPGREKIFDFLSPGQWQYLMFVQDGQQPAWGQLEVYFSLPEPASLALLAVGGLALLRRRRMA